MSRKTIGTKLVICFPVFGVCFASIGSTCQEPKTMTKIRLLWASLFALVSLSLSLFAAREKVSESMREIFPKKYRKNTNLDYPTFLRIANSDSVTTTRHKLRHFRRNRFSNFSRYSDSERRQRQTHQV